MHTCLLGALVSWSYKPIFFQESKVAPGWTQGRTMYCHTVFKYWLNNYNTRLQMALDIALCRTIKRQKSMSLDQRSGIRLAQT